MATTGLPKVVVLSVTRETPSNIYVYRKNDGSVVAGDDSMFNPLVRIEVERATVNEKYVHLRFSYSNKYWQKNESDASIAAVSNKAEEDTNKPSCTLFEPSLQSDALYLTHVQTGYVVMVNYSTNAFYLAPNTVGTTLGFVNWDTLVKLPPHIALKGDNDRYLKAYDSGGCYLQFGSDDGNDVVSGHTVSLMPDGHVRLLSDYFGMFWWYEVRDSWVYADWNESKGSETTSLFWPIKIDKNTIALRSAANGKFCSHMTSDGSGNCLAASVGTITKEARFHVEELVHLRKIYYVRYRMEDSRIYSETPFLAGTARLTNNTDKDDSMTVLITYQDEKSYTFSRGVSLKAGVKTSIETGVPFIAEGKIEVSFSISASLEWDTTTTTTTSVTASGTVPVPAMTMAVVDYVGTRGTCNIPFSYTQEDHSSTSGAIEHSQHIDGIYEGVSYYNFDFRVRSIHTL